MNAFEHGIGPGQVGGINAMYARPVEPVRAAEVRRRRRRRVRTPCSTFSGAMRELNSLLVGYSPTSGTFNEGTLTQQAASDCGRRSTRWTGRRRYRPRHAATAVQPDRQGRPLRDETKSAEQNKAWAYRNSLVMALAPSSTTTTTPQHPRRCGVTAPRRTCAAKSSTGPPLTRSFTRRSRRTTRAWRAVPRGDEANRTAAVPR
jgi:hypothetical protein